MNYKLSLEKGESISGLLMHGMMYKNPVKKNEEMKIIETCISLLCRLRLLPKAEAHEAKILQRYSPDLQKGARTGGQKSSGSGTKI